MGPTSPLTAFMSRSSAEVVSPEVYATELAEATEEIYALVQQAQERRAEENARRHQARGARPLAVGDHVLLRAPPLLKKQEEERISQKLLPKSRWEVYRIGKQVGENNFILVDMATGLEVTKLKQPVHADRLVPMEVTEFLEPLETLLNLTIEGVEAAVARQALDGRVLIRLATA